MISRNLIRMDRFSDFIPAVSTVSNLIDIFLKRVIKLTLSKKAIKANNYFAHIQTK